MTTTKYLYNIEPEVFWHEPYHEALKIKLEAGEKFYNELLEKQEKAYKSGSTFDSLYPLRKQIKKVEDAIRHNKKLLEEPNQK